MSRRNIIVFGSIFLGFVLGVQAQTVPVYRTQTLLDQGFSSPSCIKFLKTNKLVGPECWSSSNWLVWGSSPNLKYHSGPIHASLYGRNNTTGRWSVYLHDDGKGSGIEWSWLALATRKMGGEYSVPWVSAGSNVRFYVDIYPIVRRGSTHDAVARVAAIMYVRAGPGASSILGHKEVELEINIDSRWGDAIPEDPKVVFVGTSGNYLFAMADVAGIMNISETFFDKKEVVLSIPFLNILRDISADYYDILPEPKTGWKSWVVDGVGVAVESRFDGFAGATIYDIQMGSQDINVLLPENSCSQSSESLQSISSNLEDVEYTIVPSSSLN